MIKEKVILKTFPITQVGQIVHFDVKIPHDALRIIGVELNGAYPNPPLILGRGIAKLLPQMMVQATRAIIAKRFINLQYAQSPYVGSLRLQSCEKTNIFYSGDIFLADVNTGYGDYSVTPRFQSIEPTHGEKRHEFIVNTVGKTTALKGIYRDRQNPNSNMIGKGGPSGQIYTYTVNVYVWYEVDITKIKTA
ncbi:MAG: hypothetical protein ACRDFB_02360 [Rhabdochlamydiaceae bacterium]